MKKAGAMPAFSFGAMAVVEVVVNHDLFFHLPRHRLAISLVRQDWFNPTARAIDRDGSALTACHQDHRRQQQQL